MIAVVGEALVDLVIEPDGAVTAALGGAPFNTARAAARLGTAVEFVGTLSEDRFGTLLREQLVRDGVGVARAPRTSRPTTLAAAELDPDGAARYRFYVDGTSAPLLTAGDVGWPSADLTVLFTGGLGLVLAPMAETILGLVAGLPETTAVIVDVNCRPAVIDDREAYVERVFGVLARADIVKVSDEDLDYLVPGARPSEAPLRLLDRGPAVVVVTGGASATRIVTVHGSRDAPVAQPAGPVVDTIGAGDTFGGGLLAAWVGAGGRRESLRREGALDEVERAVEAAHQAAAVVVTRRGADPPWRRELPDDWAT